MTLLKKSSRNHVKMQKFVIFGEKIETKILQRLKIS